MANPIHRRRLISRSRDVRLERSVRPVMERVEGRLLLAGDVFTVNSTGISLSGTGTSGTLPYVISLANADTNSDGSEIVFNPAVFSSSSPQTISVGATLTLSGTSGPEVIDGPGAGVVSISGGHAFQVFDVESGVTATISGLTITNGSAAYGGGVDNFGELTLTECTISGNSALRFGGGMCNRAGTASLSGCTIVGNHVGAFPGGYGGGLGILGAAAATLNGCVISGNTALYNGGGVWNEQAVSLYDCTISGNTAGSDGGGLCPDKSTAALTDCTISGNVAGAGGGDYGGGGLLLDEASATLTSCTISGNSAPTGGGVFLYNGVATSQATLTDTIVAGNTTTGGGPSDIAGTAGFTNGLTGSFNLIGTGGSGGLTTNNAGNIVLTSLGNLGLGPLADNGGPTLASNNGLPTPTMALLTGSAVIQNGTTAYYTGTTNPITTDQRGLPLDAPKPDIGAYQVQPPPAATTEPATAVTSTAATLNANVDPEGSETMVWFVYGTDPSLATNTPTMPRQSIGGGTGFVPVERGADRAGAGRHLLLRSRCPKWRRNDRRRDPRFHHGDARPARRHDRGCVGQRHQRNAQCER